ncbi:MAG: FixH family protein [Proteobacteria bacterium]|nr:FixH family protein [Pseudomonadota bacterium]
MNSTDIKAWYKYPWPWVLILLPLTAVLFGIMMFVLANTYRDDLVADDYYKDGMAINRRLVMDDRARQLNIHANWTESAAGEFVFTVYNAKDSAVLLSMHHVSDRQKDEFVVLLPGDGFDYSASDTNIEKLFTQAGVWYLEIAGADDNWRLRKRLVTPVSAVELLP